MMTDTVKVKKRRYRRSTPVGRLKSNAEKLVRHASLMRARLTSWGASEPTLDLVSSKLSLVEDSAAVMRHALSSLERSGWEPPTKSSGVEYVPGDRVAIAESHRSEYEEAYADQLRDDPDMLDELVVSKVLDSGKVVVQRGKKTPFAVAKSHLVHVEEEDEC